MTRNTVLLRALEYRFNTSRLVGENQRFSVYAYCTRVAKSPIFCYTYSMKFRQALFWDTDPKKIDTKKRARYIIERVLEYGLPSEAGWVFKHYPKKTIKEVLHLPRVQVSSKSKALWLLLVK